MQVDNENVEIKQHQVQDFTFKCLEMLLKALFKEDLGTNWIAGIRNWMEELQMAKINTK